jgi:hypothetical protein
VPNAAYILREQAFWDIYYEHCSYFSPGSLARLFRRCGFDVINLATDYDDQYLMIEARPGNGAGGHILDLEDSPEDLARAIARFIQAHERKLAMWRARLDEFKQRGRRVVIWGGGSKGVAFLTRLNIQVEALGLAPEFLCV